MMSKEHLEPSEAHAIDLFAMNIIICAILAVSYLLI